MARFEESNICPTCGGKLIASPIVLTSYPPQFQAVCEKCGKTFTSYHHIGCSPVELVDSGMWCDDTGDEITGVKIEDTNIEDITGITNLDVGSGLVTCKSDEQTGTTIVDVPTISNCIEDISKRL